jgi:DNA-binding LytR/AlgR family response regulator
MQLQRSDRPDLTGLRVLVVEDMMLVAEEISEELRSCGCVVVGPAAHVREALGLVEKEALHGALLDVNLAGEFCFPIAAALRALDVPVVFLTGYSESALFPPEFRDIPRLAKPFDSSALVDLVDRHFRSSA